LATTASSINPNSLCYVIIPDTIPAGSLPAQLKLKPAYTFFDVDSVIGSIRNYSVFGNSDTSRLFWAKLLDLAYDISINLLSEPNKKKSSNAIYLAETTPDQYENRDIIKSEIIHRGFAVYPEHILTGNKEDLNGQIYDYLNKCLMSVHIIGNNYGEIIKGSEYSLTEMQYRASAKRWKDSIEKSTEVPFSKLVWSQPGTRPADERQRWFAGSMRAEENDAFTEIMQSPIEELKANLRMKMLSYDKSATKKTIEKSSNNAYLIYEPKDSKRIEDISQYLINNGIEVLAIDFKKHTENLVSTHYAYLSKAKAVIIFDFESNNLWINSKLKDVMKAPGFGRTEKFVVKAIFTTHKDRLGDLLKGSDNLMMDANLKISEALKPFVQKINSSNG
jgi:hypothetical protein